MSSRSSKCQRGFLLLAAASFAFAATDVACSSDDNDQTSDAGADRGIYDGSAIDSAPRDASGSDASSDTGVDAGPPQPNIQLAAAGRTTCAIVGGGVKCWGFNETGQLGIGSADMSPHTPTAVEGLTFVPTMIAVGAHHGCASDGPHTSCWGLDAQLQLGDVDTSTCDGGLCLTALPVGSLGTVSAMALGSNISCFVVASSVKCVGYDYAGELGAAALDTMTSTPQTIDGLSNVDAIAAASISVCAHETDNSVWCWGDNFWGELGMNADDAAADAAIFDNIQHPTPTRVPNLVARGITASGGSSNFCATAVDDTAVCWGSNTAFDYVAPAGQLGNDPLAGPSCSGLWCNPVATKVAGLTDVREVAAGWTTTCAIRTDNTVMCWGFDNLGQLDDASPVTDSGHPYNFNPQPMPGLTNIAHIAIGIYSACAVTYDNHVLCWGDNDFSSLGVPTVFSSPTPVTPVGF